MRSKAMTNPSFERDEIRRRLADPEWRLNNLYRIVAKDGREVPFRLNKFQRELRDGLWYLNLILKARQLGVTTIFCILWLDAVLFQKNKHAAIIAHTKEDAEVIFNTKVKYPYERLPEWLRGQLKARTDTLRELSFANGSSIRVATSVRSGTLQYLHISEFGYTCQKYPEKAQEIIAGSLNTVHQGQVVTIESTAKGREGHFYDMVQSAMRARQAGKELTAMDYRFFFFPWWANDEYRLEEAVSIEPKLADYFTHVEAETGTKLETAQRAWYAKKIAVLGDEMRAEYPSFPEEAFAASVEGSYYGKLVDKAILEKRVTRVPWEPKVPVDTWWDLGIDDETAILFTQSVGREVRIIDCYASRGEGLPHYAKVLRERPYVYGMHTAPHDISVRELSTGRSRLETSWSLGLAFRVCPNLPVEDGIEAGRALFPRLWIDEEKGAPFVKAASAYRKEWDDRLGTFKSHPLHNWASHYMDAYRLLGVLHQDSPLRSEVEKENRMAETFNRFSVVGEI